MLFWTHRWFPSVECSTLFSLTKKKTSTQTKKKCHHRHPKIDRRHSHTFPCIYYVVLGDTIKFALVKHNERVCLLHEIPHDSRVNSERNSIFTEKTQSQLWEIDGWRFSTVITPLTIVLMLLPIRNIASNNICKYYTKGYFNAEISEYKVDSTYKHRIHISICSTKR